MMIEILFQVYGFSTVAFQAARKEKIACDTTFFVLWLPITLISIDLKNAINLIVNLFLKMASYCDLRGIDRVISQPFIAS